MYMLGVDELGTMSACWFTQMASFLSAMATDRTVAVVFTSSALKQKQTGKRQCTYTLLCISYRFIILACGGFFTRWSFNTKVFYPSHVVIQLQKDEDV